jgi:hypothetical protein
MRFITYERMYTLVVGRLNVHARSMLLAFKHMVLCVRLLSYDATITLVQCDRCTTAIGICMHST